MKRLIALLIVASQSLTGCVGYTSFYGYESQANGAVLSAKPRKIFQVASAASQADIAQESVLSTWGKPDLSENVGGIERWTYNAGLSWRGVLLMAVVIPIPLAVPVGHDQLVLDFQSKKLAAISVRGTGSRTAYCAVPLILPHVGGCNSETTPFTGQLGYEFDDSEKLLLVPVERSSMNVDR